MIDLEKLNPKWKTCGIPTDKEGNPSPKNVILPLSQLSYPHLLVAVKSKFNPEKAATFNTGVLIPPEMDISLIKQRARECAHARWGDKVPSMKLRSPFLKAEEYKDLEWAKGWTLLRIGSNQTKPQVLMHLKDGTKIKITDAESEEIYGGRWALITVNAFAYPKAGTTGPNNGISISMNNVFLMHNDTPFGKGRPRAEDEFSDVEQFQEVGGDSAGDLF